MPKMSGNRPKASELPATLRRSPAKAQRTFAKAHDAAAEDHGEGEAAHRIAYAALKHSFEKVGDHWVAKDEKGPSDAQDRRSGKDAREGRPRPTAGGVDVEGHTRAELYERASRLGVRGRSRMTKEELGRAIARVQ